MGGRGAGAGGQGPGAAARFAKSAVDAAKEAAEDGISDAITSIQSAVLAEQSMTNGPTAAYLNGAIGDAIRRGFERVEGVAFSKDSHYDQQTGQWTAEGRRAIADAVGKIYTAEVNKFNRTLGTYTTAARKAVDRITRNRPGITAGTKSSLAQIVAAERARREYSEDGIQEKVSFDANQAVRDALNQL